VGDVGDDDPVGGVGSAGDVDPVQVVPQIGHGVVARAVGVRHRGVGGGGGAEGDRCGAVREAAVAGGDVAGVEVPGDQDGPVEAARVAEAGGGGLDGWGAAGGVLDREVA